MSAVANLSEAARTMKFLKILTPDGPIPEIAFAARMIGTFGLHFSEYLETRVFSQQNFQSRVFVNDMRGILPSIQNGLRAGKGDYEYFSTELERVRRFGFQKRVFFEKLKPYSYEVLRFTQDALFDLPLNLSSIASIESAKQRAFNLLVRRLDPPLAAPTEEKGAASPNGPVSESIQLEGELAMLKLCFNDGALFFNGKEISFGRLLKLWGSAKGNQQALKDFVEDFKRQSPILEALFKKWESEDVAPIQEFESFKTTRSFREFVCRCSAAVLEQKLRISFSHSALSHLFLQFGRNELSRSDLCYLLEKIDPLIFYQMKAFDRPSAPLFRTFQLFFFLVKTCRVASEKRDALFDMLIHRDPAKDQNLSDLPQPDRSGRKSEDPMFSAAWEAMQSVLGSISGRAVSLDQPSPEDRNLFIDPLCWPLFVTIWQNQNTEQCKTLFSSLAEVSSLAGEKPISLTIQNVYRFWKVNGSYLSEEDVQVFIGDYSEFLKTLQGIGVPIDQAEFLFLDPPVEFFRSDVKMAFGNGNRKIAQFVVDNPFSLGASPHVVDKPFSSGASPQAYLQAVRKYILKGS